MIESFADSATEKIFDRQYTRKLPEDIHGRAYRKLVILDAAASLTDLRRIPGNRLEKLHGDRKGQYSIRINRQWRICFSWRNGDAFAVEIVDYH